MPVSGLTRADLDSWEAVLSQAERDIERERRKRDYVTDPRLWVGDVLGEHMWSKQAEIAESVRDNRLTAVQSAHGPGKSWIASRLAAWWLNIHPPGDARVITTAPTGDQVSAILWTEINMAAAKAEMRGNPFIGRVNETDWKYDKLTIGLGRKPSDYNPYAFHGIHARHVLVIIDEACGVNKQFWTAALSIATGEHGRILAIGNPDDPGSHFARVCASGRWNTIKISVFDTPNFTGEPIPDELRPVLVGYEYVAEMTAEFGEESPTYISKVLGEFPDDAEDGVVPLSAIRACAMEPSTPHRPDALLPVELGVDLGAGGDETVIRERRGVLAGREWRNHERDSMKVAGKILEVIRETGAAEVKIDAIGIGWGVAGRLTELGREGKHPAKIHAVNVAETSTKPEKYMRLRSQIWWEIGRQRSQDRSWDLSRLAEADRERLVSQLTAPKYWTDSSGRIVVEPKVDTKKRLGRSPDNADALLLSYYTPPLSPAPRVRWL